MTPVFDLTGKLAATERLNCPVRIKGEPGFRIERIRNSLLEIERGIASIDHDMAELDRAYRIKQTQLTLARAMADEARSATAAKLSAAIKRERDELESV